MQPIEKQKQDVENQDGLKWVVLPTDLKEAVSLFLLQ